MVGLILALAPLAWGIDRLVTGGTGEGLLFLVIGLGLVLPGGVNLRGIRREQRSTSE